MRTIWPNGYVKCGGGPNPANALVKALADTRRVEIATEEACQCLRPRAQPVPRIDETLRGLDRYLISALRTYGYARRRHAIRNEPRVTWLKHTIGTLIYYIPRRLIARSKSPCAPTFHLQAFKQPCDINHHLYLTIHPRLIEVCPDYNQ